MAFLPSTSLQDPNQLSFPTATCFPRQVALFVSRGETSGTQRGRAGWACRLVDFRDIASPDGLHGGGRGQHQHFLAFRDRQRLPGSLPATRRAGDHPTTDKPGLPSLQREEHSIRQRLQFRQEGAFRPARPDPLSVQAVVDLVGGGACSPDFQALQKARKRSCRHSAQGRWPAARAVASSRKNNSVYRFGVITVRLRPRNSSTHTSHRFTCHARLIRPSAS